MRTFYTFCPVVRAETMNLFDLVTVGGRERYVPFEKRILWVRESFADVRVRHRSRTVTEVASLFDYRGYLTCLETAIEREVAEWHERLEMQHGDTLRIDVDLRIEEVPLLADTSREGIEHNARWDRKQYLAVPNEFPTWWFLSDKSGEGGGYPPRLERKQTALCAGLYTTARHQPGVIPPEIKHLIATLRAEAAADAEKAKVQA
jgi:hypothetical protein